MNTGWTSERNGAGSTMGARLTYDALGKGGILGLPRSFFGRSGLVLEDSSPGGNPSKTQEWTRNRSRVVYACSRQEKPKVTSDLAKASNRNLDSNGASWRKDFITGSRREIAKNSERCFARNAVCEGLLESVDSEIWEQLWLQTLEYRVPRIASSR